MTLKAAKEIFAKGMQVARRRKLTPMEKKLFVRAQQTIRTHAKPMANSARLIVVKTRDGKEQYSVPGGWTKTEITQWLRGLLGHNKFTWEYVKPSGHEIWLDRSEHTNRKR